MRSIINVIFFYWDFSKFTIRKWKFETRNSKKIRSKSWSSIG